MPAQRLRNGRLTSLALSLLFLAAGLRGAGSHTSAVHAQATVVVRYAAGWNLVGAPSGTHFSAARGDLYTLESDGAYAAVSAGAGSSAGQGYWAYFETETSLTLAPADPAIVQIEAPAGVWLMLGNPGTVAARLSGSSSAYTYDPVQGYTPAETLPAGRGAFVYSEAGGTIALTPAPDLIRALPAAPAAAPAAGSSVQVIASGVGQARAGGPVSVGLLLRNSGRAATDLTPLSITVYDAEGAVIAAGDASLHYLAAGETTGFVQRLTVAGASAVPARVDVHAGAGHSAGDPLPGEIRFSQINLSATRTGLTAAAVLKSSYATDLSEVHVSALVYDAAGAIIGGGTTIKRLVPAGSASGVLVGVEVSGAPARVEFYAQLP